MNQHQTAVPLSRWKRRLRYLRRGGAAVLGVAAMLFLLVQTPWGGRAAVRLALRLFNPFEGAHVEVGGVSGNFVNRLDLREVRLVRDDGVALLRVDTLAARFRLLPLLQKELHLRSVSVVNPVVTLSQGSDGAWGLASLLPADTTATPSGRPFRVRIDEATLTGGRGTMAFYAPGRDSSLRLMHLSTRLVDLHTGAATALGIDTLTARFQPPGSPEPVALALGGRLTGGLLVVRGLRLTSAESDVTGSLRLPLSAPPESLHVALTAQPLALRDIHPFWPTLDPSARLTLSVAARGAAGTLTLDAQARASDGATLSLQGMVATGGTLRFRLTGRVRDFDPALFAGGEPLGRMRGSVDVDLAGPARDSLDGTVHLTLDAARFGAMALGPTTLHGVLNRGEARIAVDGTLLGGDFRVAGTLRPLDTTPAYDLAATLRHLDVGRLAEGLVSDLNGTVTLAGHGLGVGTARARARLTLATSAWNGAQVSGGTAEVIVAEGRLRSDARLAFPGGAFTMIGTAGLSGDRAFAVEKGRLVNVPLAALAGDTTRSTVNGVFSLSGHGTEMRSLHLDASAHLDSTAYDVFLVRSADLTAALRAGRLDLTAKAALRGAALDLALQARPFAATPVFELTRGVFGDLDVGVLLQTPGQRSRLQGNIRLKATGFDPATMAFRAVASLDPSTLNRQAITAASLVAEGDRGRFRGEAVLRLPGGVTHLAGTWAPFAQTPSFKVTSDDLTDVDLGALLGLPGVSTRLNGALSVAGSGYAPADMDLDVRMILAGSKLNDAVIQDALADLEMRQGTVRLVSRVNLERGTVRLSAEGRPFDATPRFSMEGQAEKVDLARFAGIDSVASSATFGLSLEGEGLDPATMRLAGRMVADTVRFGDVVLDRGHAGIRLERGLARVDSLMLHANVAWVQGTGAVAVFDTLRASDFRFELVLADLHPLGRFLDVSRVSIGDGRLDGTVTGPSGALQVDARLDLSSLVYDDVHVVGFEARLGGTFDAHRTLTHAGVQDAVVSFFSVPAFSMQRAEFSGTYRPGQITFGTDFRVDRRRRGGLRARIDLDPDHRVITLDSLGLRMDQDRWELLQEATITYGDLYEVRNLLLFAENQQIALDGEVNLNGEQSLILTLEGLRIASVADLFGYEGLGGTLDGWIVMGGTAPAPVLDGTLDLDLTTFGVSTGDLHMELQYAGGVMQVQAQLNDENGQPLTLDGQLPLDFRLVPPADQGQGVSVTAHQAVPESEVALHLGAADFSIGWVLPILDRSMIDALAGKLTADVAVRGTVGAPLLTGEAMLREGRIGVPLLGKDQGLVYHDAAVDLEFSRNQVRVKHVELHSGRGTVVGVGTVDLSELTLGEFNIDLDAVDFLAIDSREYRVEAGGKLTLRGTTRAPVLSGVVGVVSADFFLTEENTSEAFEPVQLTQEDEQILARRFGVRLTESDTTTFDFYEALTIENLTVILERDTWLRSKTNPVMDIQFTGDLDVRKQPHADPIVFGVINVLPERSRIGMFGKRFTLERGTLTFNGPATDPIMDIKALYVVRSRGSGGNEATITLEVKGLLEDLEVTPGSDPPMEVSDIISYLAFGQPASEAFQFGGGGTGEGGLLNPATGFAVGQLTGFIENLAGTGLGLDVIDIEQDGLKGATVTAGKYLSPRLYIAVSQPISFRKTTVGTGEENAPVYQVEYELINRLLIRLLRDGQVIRINMKWEYAY